MTYKKKKIPHYLSIASERKNFMHIFYKKNILLLLLLIISYCLTFNSFSTAGYKYVASK